LLIVIGDRITGTAEDAAAARASLKLLRSAHMTSKFCGRNTTRDPVASSVAPTAIAGPLARARSAKVEP